MQEAAAWLAEQTHRSSFGAWKAVYGRDAAGDDAYGMTFPGLVTSVITRAWRITPPNGNLIMIVAVAFADIGLDLVTGTLAQPTVFGVPWLIVRFFQES